MRFSLLPFPKLVRPFANMASASAPSSTATKAEDVPWHANLPAPKSTAASISRQDLLTLFSEKTVGKDFVLVDLRRTDYEVSHS
jgi:arsenical-resistance protein 2